MAVKTPSAAQEQAAAALIEAAAAQLPAGPSGVPSDFIVALFSRAVAEDLLRYTPADLAALAAAAWEFIAARKQGTPKVRCEPTPTAAAGALTDISTIEIVN